MAKSIAVIGLGRFGKKLACTMYDMGADVRSTVIGMTKDIKASLDKLTPEEREMYFELCGKADDSDSEQ